MSEEQWTTPGEDMGLVLNRIGGHMECAQRAYSVRQRTADPGKCECFACTDFRALRAMISAERTAAQAEAERLRGQLDAERGKGQREALEWAKENRRARQEDDATFYARGRAALARAGEGEKHG